MSRDIKSKTIKINRYTYCKNEISNQSTKALWFLAPIQALITVQWWSNFKTQELQNLQCDERGGLIILQVSHFRG